LANSCHYRQQQCILAVSKSGNCSSIRSIKNVVFLVLCKKVVKHCFQFHCLLYCMYCILNCQYYVYKGSCEWARKLCCPAWCLDTLYYTPLHTIIWSELNDDNSIFLDVLDCSDRRCILCTFLCNISTHKNRPALNPANLKVTVVFLHLFALCCGAVI